MALSKKDRERKDFYHRAIEDFEKRLTTYALRLTGRLEVAQDVVQETYLQLWKADLEKVRLHWPAWLFAVCRYRVIDRVRKEKRVAPLSVESQNLIVSGEKSSENKLIDREQDSEIMKWVENLPEPQKEAVWLKFKEELSYKEISEVMEISVSHVGVLIHLGITTLRNQMNKKGSDL